MRQKPSRSPRGGFYNLSVCMYTTVVVQPSYFKLIRHTLKLF